MDNISGPFVAKKTICQTGKVVVSGYWVFPERTEECDHSCFLIERNGFPTCVRCGTPADLEVNPRNIRLEDPVVESRAFINNNE